jgi:nucleoside-diphosphate-sugar epimerase
MDGYETRRRCSWLQSSIRYQARAREKDSCGEDRRGLAVRSRERRGLRTAVARLVARRKPKDNGEAGVYNVVDDESATAAEWMPLYAEALGAKWPPRVPAFVARLIAGRALVEWSLRLQGASNEKIKEELGLRPQYESWRRRFVEDVAAATPGGVAN